MKRLEPQEITATTRLNKVYRHYSSARGLMHRVFTVNHTKGGDNRQQPAAQKAAGNAQHKKWLKMYSTKHPHNAGT